MEPNIKITLDKEYPLRWDFEEMIAFEKEFKKNIVDSDWSLETLLQKLTVMLRKAIPEITFDKTKELVFTYRPLGGIDITLEKIGAAIINGQYAQSANPTKPTAEENV